MRKHENGVPVLRRGWLFAPGVFLCRGVADENRATGQSIGALRKRQGCARFRSEADFHRQWGRASGGFSGGISGGFSGGKSYVFTIKHLFTSAAIKTKNREIPKEIAVFCPFKMVGASGVEPETFCTPSQ